MLYKKNALYTGAVIGGIIGVALPAYIGWEIGEYVQRHSELTKLMSTTIKITSSTAITGLTYNLTVPLGVFAGIVTEKIFKNTFNRVKNSLENLLILNNQNK